MAVLLWGEAPLNPRRLAPLTALLAFTIGVAADPHTTERITPQAAAASIPTTAPDPYAGIPAPDQQPIPGDCASWFGTAMRAGWTWNDWPRLSRIMWRESRCQPDVFNGRGRDQSFGLVQINTKGRLWDRPIAWGYPSLKDLCGLTARDELLDGYTNLRCGRLLFEVHADVYGNGWKPWGVR